MNLCKELMWVIYDQANVYGLARENNILDILHLLKRAGISTPIDYNIDDTQSNQIFICKNTTRQDEKTPTDMWFDNFIDANHYAHKKDIKCDIYKHQYVNGQLEETLMVKNSIIDMMTDNKLNNNNENNEDRNNENSEDENNENSEDENNENSDDSNNNNSDLSESGDDSNNNDENDNENIGSVSDMPHEIIYVIGNITHPYQ